MLFTFSDDGSKIWPTFSGQTGLSGLNTEEGRKALFIKQLAIHWL